MFPDYLSNMKLRYDVLREISRFQPIGRRGLAANVDLTERTIRGEVELLQDRGLIEVTPTGMMITNEGESVLQAITPFILSITGIHDLEIKLKDKLNIDQVMIAPGNSDENGYVKKEMGQICTAFLRGCIQEDSTIAVTGGTTVHQVAEAMKPFKENVSCLFVPARGGMDNNVETQANTIAAQMAKQTGGNYRLLNVPDPLHEDAYHMMKEEPSIKNTLKEIKNADIVLHGIGDALKMAERRKSSHSVLQKLTELHAVSEAFGYYFNQAGEVVHQVRTIGIRVEDLSKAKSVIALAGGKSKANAIKSYFKQGKSDLLITDEAAANSILTEK